MRGVDRGRERPEGKGGVRGDWRMEGERVKGVGVSCEDEGGGGEREKGKRGEWGNGGGEVRVVYRRDEREQVSGGGRVRETRGGGGKQGWLEEGKGKEGGRGWLEGEEGERVRREGRRWA